MKRLDTKDFSYKRFFGIIVILSFIFWLVAIIIDPYSAQREIFFLKMDDFWADATNTTGLTRLRNPYLDSTIGLENAAYPPLAYAMFYLLARAAGAFPYSYLDYFHQPLWTLLFVITLILAIVMVYTLIIKQFGGVANVDSILVGVAVCVSFPMIHTLERGNIIILAMLALMVYIFYYDSNSKIKKEIAILCLAFAAGLKLTPAVFGVLLIYNKDWKTAIRAVIYGIAACILPFFMFQDGLKNIMYFLHNVSLHSNNVHAVNGVGLSEIISYWYTAILYKITGSIYKINSTTTLVIAVVRIIISALFIISGFFMKEKWKKILNVSLVLLILPPVSQQYCLLYLIPMMVLFLKKTSVEKKHNLWDKIILISIILICFDYKYSAWFDVGQRYIAILALITVSVVYSIQAIINLSRLRKV